MPKKTVQEQIADYLKPNMKKKAPAKIAAKFVKKKGMVKAQSQPYTPPVNLSEVPVVSNRKVARKKIQETVDIPQGNKAIVKRMPKKTVKKATRQKRP